MLSKLCMQLLVGVAVIGSSVYSADAVGHAAVEAAHVRVGSDRVTFQGVVPNAAVGMPWYLDQLVHQVQNPGWNGVLEVNQWNNLSNLTDEQLRTLGERIEALPILGGRHVIFAPAVPAPTAMDINRQEVRMEQFDATLMRPFADINPREVKEIFELPFGQFIADPKSKRSKEVLDGWTLGRAWSFLGEFIKYYNFGIHEVALLMENAREVDPELRKIARDGLAALKDASDSWNALKTEFDKVPGQRNRENIEKADHILRQALQFLYEFLGFEKGFDPRIRALMDFVSAQPGDKVFEAFMQSRGGFAVDAAHQAAAPEKTTSEMLDDLLTTKPNKDIAAAVEGAAPGLVKTIRLGGDRLWNVYKLDDPQAAKWQENAQHRAVPGGWYNGMYWQFNQEVVAPCEAQFIAVAEKLNLKDGSYTMLVRVPAGGSHQFRVLGVMVRHDQWNPVTNRNDAIRVTLEKHIGLVEIVEAKAGDEKVPMYDPLRVHSADSIRGTMMAQRVHEAMAAHRVHQFGKLPENVRVHLREQVEAYTDQRTMNRLENQRLHQYAPTRDEVKLPVGADADRIHALAQSKAAKLSGELKDRLAADRALRMRTHGDDLMDNPSQHMQTRVHDLFDRVHDKRKVMNGLDLREKEFYRDNKPGGYVDTVERAVAAQHVHYDGAEGRVHGDPRPRIHYERLHGARLHAERLHGGNHAVAVSAPGTQYGNISDAIHDYDLGGNDDGEPGRAAFFANADGKRENERKHDD